MRGFQILIAVLSVIFLNACVLEEERAPNILFIMSDDHTSQAWGIYNGVLDEYVKNNGIKYLAENGTVLNAFGRFLNRIFYCETYVLSWHEEFVHVLTCTPESR